MLKLKVAGLTGNPAPAAALELALLPLARVHGPGDREPFVLSSSSC